MPMEVLESDEKATEWAEQELIRRREQCERQAEVQRRKDIADAQREIAYQQQKLAKLTKED